MDAFLSVKTVFVLVNQWYSHRITGSFIHSLPGFDCERDG